MVSVPRSAIADGVATAGAGAAAAPVVECDTCNQREANGVVVRAGRSIGLMRTSNPPGGQRR
jgi:hypothetical protein